MKRKRVIAISCQLFGIQHVDLRAHVKDSASSFSSRFRIHPGPRNNWQSQHETTKLSTIFQTDDERKQFKKLDPSSSTIRNTKKVRNNPLIHNIIGEAPLLYSNSCFSASSEVPTVPKQIHSSVAYIQPTSTTRQD